MPLASSLKTKILLLSEETKTASVILDVLSSVDYQILMSDEVLYKEDLNPMILILNLDFRAIDTT